MHTPLNKSEQRTMLELLAYPPATGTTEDVMRWRSLCAMLLAYIHHFEHGLHDPERNMEDTITTLTQRH